MLKYFRLYKFYVTSFRFISANYSLLVVINKYLLTNDLGLLLHQKEELFTYMYIMV